MDKSRKKPMRTYGRKKTKVRYVKTYHTDINVHNTFYQFIINCNTSQSNAEPPKQKSNLYDICNSSSERKFDLLIGKKPTNVFSSSNSSSSTLEQLSGLKVSSLLTSSLGSIHENLPLASTSQTSALERRVAEVTPINNMDDIHISQFKVTKHVCLSIAPKARKLRISKRFSIGRDREDIGNSTPIESRKKELDSPIIEDWGLSPIIGTVESDSLNLSNSPDIFGSSDSDNGDQLKDENRVTKRLVRRKRSSIKRHSIMPNRNIRKSIHQGMKECESSEVIETCSVISRPADYSTNILKYMPLPTCNETDSVLTSANDFSTSNLFLNNADDDVDQQSNSDGDNSLTELSLKLSNLDVETLPNYDDNKDCNQHISDVAVNDSKPCAESQHFYSESCKRVEEKEENENHTHCEIENSSNESDEETENNSLVAIDDSLESYERKSMDINKDDYDDEENDDDDEEDDDGAKEDDDDDEPEEEEDDDDDEPEEEDSDGEKINDNEDGEERGNNANLTKNTMLENTELKTTNVLDADNTVCLPGFELDEHTYDFIPGKMYRRSIAALRHSKLSSTGNLSHVGCNRFSIIRPSVKVKASSRMTLITTTIEECYDETVSLINVDEDKCAAKQHVLRLCDQSDILSFDSVLSESLSTKMKKIGEGVYGEVFMITRPGKREESAVIKIIPIEGDVDYNGEIQKKFHEILSEIYISQALSNLKKEDIRQAEFWTDIYCSIISSNCFQGCYPRFLLDLWNIYSKNNGTENDSPEIFTENQLYISLKMSHGGEDIQKHEFASARQSYYIVLQVIFALAVAECALQFEHRDLHIGNVLISKTKAKSTFFKINGTCYKVPTFWKKATIIDYTLSRVNSENLLFYNDLGKDEELFLGQGDIQFQVYRDMQDDLKNEWQKYEPKTNVRWIHYLATKCYSNAAYTNDSTKTHKVFIKKLKSLADEVLIYSSCSDYVANLGFDYLQ